MSLSEGIVRGGSGLARRPQNDPRCDACYTSYIGLGHLSELLTDTDFYSTPISYMYSKLTVNSYTGFATWKQVTIRQVG